ncbi:MAG: universal stress protein [Haloferacaceae archaeon]
MDVLVPVDGSDCSIRAVEFAVEFADRYDASLRVVHFSDAETDATEAILDRAREALDGADADLEVALRDMPLATATQAGKAILAYVEDEDVDHVVMGHHGSGRVERAILGSAAETVVRGETVPVTVVP